jgi:hypothetical protein
VLIPGTHQLIAVQSQVTNNIVEFMARKAKIDRDGKVMEPYFRLAIPRSDVHVCRFAGLIRVEKSPV